MAKTTDADRAELVRVYGYKFLPDLITAPGIYETREGLWVMITHVGPRRGERRTCFGYYPNGVREHWHPTGHIFSRETVNDIVKPVLVRR